jgi:hypothetical protein
MSRPAPETPQASKAGQWFSAQAMAADPLACLSTAYLGMSEGEMLPIAMDWPHAGFLWHDLRTTLDTLAPLCGFALLESPDSVIHLQRLAEPGLRVACATPQDTPALLALFASCFDTPMDETLWHWKYRQHGHHAVVWQRGQIIAHDGGITRKTLLFGRQVLATQNGDVMVAPQARGLLTRQGAFYRAAVAYTTAYCGYGRRHLIGVGFPNRRHLIIAQRLGLYRSVGEMVEWRLAAQPAPSALRLVEGQPEDQQVDGLFAAMAQAMRDGIVGIRDSTYCRYRYAAHPMEPYRWMTLVSANGEYMGIVVAREHAGRLLVMDLIAHPDHFPLLLQHAAHKAWQLGLPHVAMWIPAARRSWLGTGGETIALGIAIPTNSFSPGPPTEALQDRWWLTAGDTDFL